MHVLMLSLYCLKILHLDDLWTQQDLKQMVLAKIPLPKNIEFWKALALSFLIMVTVHNNIIITSYITL